MLISILSWLIGGLLVAAAGVVRLPARPELDGNCADQPRPIPRRRTMSSHKRVEQLALPGFSLGTSYPTQGFIRAAINT
ncbi:hypothetical protein RFN28_27645 [Mesorhizobium sp. VK24D]|uniref:Uncharacterized protein n=1 Tax=Mesorhizobium album TaxID=3072314 RepID=A0ABU4Y5I3_9HYPH|nr:hypothetical protein [Mesorhizobium sp. VK24D]MDX8482202.1 hypothetical protein [Mesorhizobium sp. VK24D]